MKVENVLESSKKNMGSLLEYLGTNSGCTHLFSFHPNKEVLEMDETKMIVQNSDAIYHALSFAMWKLKQKKVAKKSVIKVSFNAKTLTSAMQSRMKALYSICDNLVLEFENEIKEVDVKSFCNPITSSYLYGYINYDDKQLRKKVILLGKNLEYSATDKNDVSVLAIVHAYNEEDIIERTISYLVSQGIDIHIVDNWSTDKTYSLAEKWQKKLEKEKSERKIFLSHFPEIKPDESIYDWTNQLKLTEIIAQESDYDWIIHYDADEIRSAPWKNVTLKEAIGRVDKLGYNAINNTVIDFRLTKEDLIKKDIFSKKTYFSFGNRPGHFLQIKTWKNIGTVDLSSSGGHMVKFDSQRVYPLKVLNRHYPLRSKEQALKKIFKDRIPRSEKEKKEKGWHIQYDNVVSEKDVIYDKEGLIKLTEKTYEYYLLELITGVGIKRN